MAARYAILCALPLPTGQTRQLAALLTDLKRRGFSRIYQNGQTFDSRPESLLRRFQKAGIPFSGPPESRAGHTSTLHRLGGNLLPREQRRSRSGSARLAVWNGSLPRKTIPIQRSVRMQEMRIRTKIRTASFLFHNPFGACPRCQGFGNTIDLNLDLCFPTRANRSWRGAIEPWTKPHIEPTSTISKRPPGDEA